jgi:CRISPR-associated protein Cmr3
VSSKCILIEPSDVWLFRDGRPFGPNERGKAVSLFPPTPRTMQGVIRSALLAQAGASFTDQSTWPVEVGTPDNFGTLELRGPLIAKREGDACRRFFALPLDVSRLQNGWHSLSPRSGSRFETNWDPALQPLLPPEDSEPSKFDTGLLDESGFLSYLRGGQLTDARVIQSDCLYRYEARVGVQIDSQSKRPPEGMLYQVEFVRLEWGVGLLLEVSGVSLSNTGLLQLGGEARAGFYKTVPTAMDLPRDERTPSLSHGKRHFKLCFATPAIFNNGWLPAWLDPQSLLGKQGDRRGEAAGRLVSAAVGKPQPIGGRDIARRDRQRAIRRAVPAGSVYFFETEASADEVFETFDGQCVSDADARIGFGLCFVGGWENV